MLTTNLFFSFHYHSTLLQNRHTVKNFLIHIFLVVSCITPTSIDNNTSTLPKNQSVSTALFSNGQSISQTVNSSKGPLANTDRCIHRCRPCDVFCQCRHCLDGMQYHWHIQNVWVALSTLSWESCHKICLIQWIRHTIKPVLINKFSNIIS